MNSAPHEPSTAAESRPGRTGPGARLAVAGLIAGVTFGLGGYKLLTHGGLQQTSALFVGLPTLMAIVVVLFVAPKSAAGVAIKVVTVALLLSMPLLQEGMLCVALSAPLFYAAALAVAELWREWHTDRRSGGRRIVSGALALTLLPMSLEGVTAVTTVPRSEVVTVVRQVPAPFDAVRAALSSTPRFDRIRPALLRHGFPWPEAARVDGDRWTVAMRGGETRLTGMEPKTGDLRLRLVAEEPGVALWHVEHDASHMTHFLRWTSSEVHYRALDSATTEVTWTIHYERALDPAWYFGPMERAAVRLAAAYLVDAVATP